MALIEQTDKAEFCIYNLEERDDHGCYLPGLTVCTFDSELWKVKLGTGETLAVRQGDDEFIVVERD